MIEMLVYLIAAHAFFDYAGQGDFMAKAKNPSAPIPGVPWYQPMAAHCAIHGAAVYAITGLALLGLVEFIAHGVTDYAKCRGWISYNADQAIHVACKVAYVAWVFA